MLTIELLKTYSTANDLQLYDKKDEYGQFALLVRQTIVEWEKGIRKGITTKLPKEVEDVALDLAIKFVKVCGFKHNKKEKNENLKQLSEWALAQVFAYYNSRMDELGATKENLLTSLIDDGQESKVPVFSCNPLTGDVNILVTRLNGDAIYYEKQLKPTKTGEEQSETCLYYVTRLANPIGSNKYMNPKGAPVAPFFAEKTKQAFLNKEKIETLVITEGQIVAFKATMHDIHTVGLPGITQGRDPASTKQKPKLHQDIIDLIKVCQIENVVVMWDGDCTNISIKHLDNEQELTIRPVGFFNAAKTIRDYVVNEKFSHNVKVYFSTIRTDYVSFKPKGLDDLLIGTEQEDLKKEAKKLPQVIKKALSLQGKGNPYFFFCKITTSTEQLHEFFGLKTPEQFRNKHLNLIDNKEFVFKGDRWVYSEIKNELKMLQPSFLKDVRYVGDHFYRLVAKPIPTKSDDEDQLELVPVSPSTMTNLYGKGFAKYLRDKHYIGFCNIPNHFNHQIDIETKSGKFYNKSFPFEYKPKEGKFDTIKMFVEHIFGVQSDMGFDYLQLLLNNPTQKLPVIILYSAENNTGKSKFGELISNIFKNNTIFINNDDLKSEFGMDRYADKLVAVCEETLIERKKDVERIKFISTALEPVTCNPKGMKAYQIHTYVKLIFTSNNLRMIHATEEDERFWILLVPVPPTKDPDLLEKMKAEIPAFVHWLKNRKMANPKEGRMWFDSKKIKTEILQDVIKVNEHGDVQEFRSKLEDYFIEFPNETDLMLSTKDIIEELMPGKARNWINEICETRLKVKKYQINGKSAVKCSYIMKSDAFHVNEDISFKPKKHSKKGQRVWVFPRKQFLLEELNYDEAEGSDLTQEAIDKIHDAA